MTKFTLFRSKCVAVREVVQVIIPQIGTRATHLYIGAVLRGVQLLHPVQAVVAAAEALLLAFGSLHRAF